MIRGLTDRVEPAFPRLGKLRKGGVKPERGPGRELEFFRFTSERPEVERAFADAYGEAPALLHVYLPYAEVEQNFSAWKEEWAGGGLVHRCDGESMVLWRTPEGKFSREAAPCPYASGAKPRSRSNPGCDEVARLTVILPELIRAGHVGYVTLETHSINDILGMQSVLLAVAEARAGSELGLRGVEFILRRTPEMISTPGEDGKRVRRQKWLVRLEPAPAWVELQLDAARQMTLPGPGQATAIAQGRVVDTGTGELLDEPEEPEWEEGEVVEPEPTVTPPAPAAASAPDAPAAGRKLASLKRVNIGPHVAALIEQAPHYRKPDGSADYNHVLGAAAKLGYPEINPENVEAVMDALLAYGMKQTAVAS